MRIVFVFLTLGAVVVLSYFIVGREMNFLLTAAAMVLVFLISFFSVRISLALLIMSLLLSPEIAVGATAKRAITARLDDILLFTMTMSWMLRMAIFKDIGFMLKTPLSLPIAVYSVIAIISTTLGVFRGNVQSAPGFFFTLKIIEYFFLFTMIVNNVQTEKEVNNILNLLIIACGAMCVFGIFQVVSGGNVAAAFGGAGGERNTLGGYFVLMGSVIAGVVLHTKSNLEKTFLSIMLAGIIVVLLFSVSRSGWVSSIVAVVVLLMCVKQKNIYLMTITIMLFCIPFFIPTVVHERINFTLHQAAHPMEQFVFFGFHFDTSTSARIFGAQAVLQQFFKHPFFGFGITGWVFIDGQFFRVLIETGLFGLASFLWLLTGVHGIIRRVMKIELAPRLQGMVVGFYAGFWGLMVHAFSTNTFIIVRISEPFWCLAGLTVILYIAAQTKTSAASVTSEAEIALTNVSPQVYS
jgi:O-Antigen ligase.